MSPRLPVSERRIYLIGGDNQKANEFFREGRFCVKPSSSVADGSTHS